MHIAFRQFAQQMGMQNVRAILPEQIDLVLNTAQDDILIELIKQHIGATNDRVITDNSKLGQINAFRTLYQVAIVDMSPMADGWTDNRIFSFSSEDRDTGKMSANIGNLSNNTILPNCMYLYDFAISYRKVIHQLGYNGVGKTYSEDNYAILTPNGYITKTKEYSFISDYGTETITFNVFNPITKLFEERKFKPVVLSDGELALHCTEPVYTSYYLGIRFEDKIGPYYSKGYYCLTKEFMPISSGNVIIVNPLVIHKNGEEIYITPTFDLNTTETKFYPVRLIDDRFLADTLNDYILKPRIRSPIIVAHNTKVDDNSTLNLDIYIDKFKEVSVNTADGSETRYVLDYDLIPYKLRVSYIAKPNKIKYSDDIDPSKTVNCNLPEYLHMDVVKRAVDLWRMSITGSMMSSRQQEQVAGQENVRNNYRNEQTT